MHAWVLLTTEVKSGLRDRRRLAPEKYTQAQCSFRSVLSVIFKPFSFQTKIKANCQRPSNRRLYDWLTVEREPNYFQSKFHFFSAQFNEQHSLWSLAASGDAKTNRIKDHQLTKIKREVFEWVVQEAPGGKTTEATSNAAKCVIPINADAGVNSSN